MANFVLMNKNTPVVAFEYDLERHEATRITRIENPAYAPFGMVDRDGRISRRELNYWWRHRAIPASRDQISRLLESLKLDTTLELAEKSFGLSLSDRYWINDENDPRNWADINFFDNDFTDDLGFLTLGQDSSDASTGDRDYDRDYTSINLASPNSTLGGDLLKKWKIVNGTRVLLKAGVGAFNQEPYNEVIMTNLHERLMASGEFTSYRLFTDNRHVYSACDNMLGPDEELVSAWDVIRNVKKSNNLSDLGFLVQCYERLGLDGDMVMQQLAKMFACDFVLANRDRHYRNFGVIRNVETLKVTRLAPVFDSGSCLWSNAELLEVPVDFAYTAKPFKGGMRPDQQLRLFVGHFGWFASVAASLQGFAERAAQILSTNPNIPQRRVEIVREHIDDNIAMLLRIVG